MIAKQHPAESDINTRLKDLLVRQQELKTLTAERKLKLLDAVESQTVCLIDLKEAVNGGNGCVCL
jgi:hypothetical protein